MIRGVPPLIGITADVSSRFASIAKTRDNAALYLPRRYMAAIVRAGAIPVIVAPAGGKIRSEHLLDRLDGLMLSGGNFDIHPRHYGERPLPKLGEIKTERTAFELGITTEALRRNLPILGICGGAQAINVALGGSLYQDIASQIPGAGPHEQGAQTVAVEHPIRVKSGTRLFEILGRHTLIVNSTHHQSVKQIGRGLTINAVAADSVIEGIESTLHGFVLGVQWHPEVLARRRRIHQRLFSAFVASCKRRPKKR